MVNVCGHELLGAIVELPALLVKDHVVGIAIACLERQGGRIVVVDLADGFFKFGPCVLNARICILSCMQ